MNWPRISPTVRKTNPRRYAKYHQIQCDMLVLAVRLERLGHGEIARELRDAADSMVYDSGGYPRRHA